MCIRDRFDLDGTLLNTLEDLTIAGNHVCESHGWPTYTADQFQMCIRDRVSG